MVKPAKKAYSLKELAKEWSKRWKDDVSDEDILSYAQDGRLIVNTLITRRQFHVTNINDINDNDELIAPDGTTWLFDVFLPLDRKWASVLIQEGNYSIVNLNFNDMQLNPVGGILNLGLKDHYVLFDDKIKFEQSLTNTPSSVAIISDNTLLSTIAALLASWPEGKQPSAKDLEKAANSVGVKVSDDSIRKALNAAKGLAPSLGSAY